MFFFLTLCLQDWEQFGYCHQLFKILIFPSRTKIFEIIECPCELSTNENVEALNQLRPIVQK